MNTEKISREQISAMADGELVDRQLDAALATLREKTAQDTWEIYHQIGDVLRSDDMAVTLSGGFAARMTARLDAEPTIVAPTTHVGADDARSSQQIKGNVRSTRQWRVPGMVAAAAMAAVAFIATPQLMVALQGGEDVVDKPMAILGEVTVPGKVASAGVQQTAVEISPVSEGVVLRDPRIDDYLFAHQRFSPSVYSTAQYARSATFATNSDK